MNAFLALTFEETNRVAHFGAKTRKRSLAGLGHSRIPLLNKHASAFEIDRTFCGQRFIKKFTAVIDAAGEHQLSLLANQDGALQMAHVEEEEGFVLKSLRIGEAESVEGTNGCELKHVGRALGFAHR